MAGDLVAAQKKLFEEEGVKTPDFVVPGAAAKVVQALAAGQVPFALGDSNHPRLAARLLRLGPESQKR